MESDDEQSARIAKSIARKGDGGMTHPAVQSAINILQAQGRHVEIDEAINFVGLPRSYFVDGQHVTENQIVYIAEQSRHGQPNIAAALCQIVGAFLR